MNEIKYTTDGKKVAIIGNLNSKEYIVQEIFVTKDGAEIPSGENFVVKSLHDEPVVTWQERSITKIKEEYNQKLKYYETEIRSLENRLRVKRNELTGYLTYLDDVIKEDQTGVIQSVRDVLTGVYTYVVHETYSIPNILTLEATLKNETEYDRERLKLLSVFGKDNGSWDYRIGEYSDGSGSSHRVFFCKSESEAIERARELIEKHTTYFMDDIKWLKNHNMPLDQEKLQAFKDQQLKEINKAQDSINDNIIKYNDRIKEIESL